MRLHHVSLCVCLDVFFLALLAWNFRCLFSFCLDAELSFNIYNVHKSDVYTFVSSHLHRKSSNPTAKRVSFVPKTSAIPIHLSVLMSTPSPIDPTVK